MKRSLYAGLAAALLALVPAPLLAQGPNDHSAMAINIDQLNYYSTEWTLVDAFKKSSGWITGCGGNCTSPVCTPQPAPWMIFNTGEQSRLDLDENGWVRSLPAASDASVCYRHVRNLVFMPNNRQRLSGRYVVRYEGEGTLNYAGGGQVVSSSPGRDVISIGDNHGLIINITATNPANHLRNIRVIWPGGICNGDEFDYGADEAACTSNGKTYTSFEDNHATQIFHPLFMQDLRHYRAIRYMQLLRTNDNINTLTSWSQVPSMSHAFWSSVTTSPPWELPMRLSNKLRADAWINIPTKADDDFVQQAAQLAKDHLDASLKVYVEYGNEIWNNAWPYTLANQWVLAQGRAFWNDATTDQNVVRGSWFGMRSQQICRIWKQVWAEQSGRVVCVMGGFSATPWINRQALSCPKWVADSRNTTGANCAADMDTLAIAPYFAGHLGNPSWLPTLQAWMQEPDGGFNSLFAEVAGPSMAQITDFTRRNASLAAEFGLTLTAYEAGGHFIGTGSVANNPAVTAFFAAANRDPRMGQMYRLYMDMWKQEGGRINAIYNSVSPSTNAGSVGTKEWTGQPRSQAPKFDAIINFVESTDCWWEGCGR